jgi:hypothetical protein
MYVNVTLPCYKCKCLRPKSHFSEWEKKVLLEYYEDGREPWYAKAPLRAAGDPDRSWRVNEDKLGICRMCAERTGRSGFV